MASSGFSCTHCAKEFNGPVPYFAHLQTDKHRKKAAQTQVGGALGPGGDASGAGGIVGSGDGSTELKPRAPPMRRKTSRPIICRVCNVPVNSKISLEIHNKGKNHQRLLKNEDYRARLEAIGDAAPSQAGTSAGRSGAARTTPSAPTTEKQSTVEPGVVDLSCQRCGIVLFKSIEHKVEHLRNCPRFSSPWWNIVQSYDDEDDWETLMGLMQLTIREDR